MNTKFCQTLNTVTHLEVNKNNVNIVTIMPMCFRQYSHRFDLYRQFKKVKCDLFYLVTFIVFTNIL